MVHYIPLSIKGPSVHTLQGAFCFTIIVPNTHTPNAQSLPHPIEKPLPL
jgi:hypothetical protein